MKRKTVLHLWFPATVSNRGRGMEINVSVAENQEWLCSREPKTTAAPIGRDSRPRWSQMEKKKEAKQKHFESPRMHIQKDEWGRGVTTRRCSTNLLSMVCTSSFHNSAEVTWCVCHLSLTNPLFSSYVPFRRVSQAFLWGIEKGVPVLILTHCYIMMYMNVFLSEQEESQQGREDKVKLQYITFLLSVTIFSIGAGLYRETMAIHSVVVCAMNAINKGALWNCKLDIIFKINSS